MRGNLAATIGQHSEAGRKPANQDFYGALIPEQPQLDLKGIAIALADGISTSAVSSIAAQTAVASFLHDYYDTSDSWQVKTAAQRVIASTNSWLHGQTRRQYDAEVDSGYVCTLSVLILKGRAAHIFHIGDSRIYRLSGHSLEQLTVDHRVPAPAGRTYLSRALGIGSSLEIDYRTTPLAVGDVFVLTTDGVHEHAGPAAMLRAIETHAGDLDAAASAIARDAYDQGSADNLTVQLVRIDALPDGAPGDFLGTGRDLPPPPALEPRMLLDGYRIVRLLHANSRSQVHLAEDTVAGGLVVIKVPGEDVRADAAQLNRFMLEEWIARRINNPHVLKSPAPDRPRTALYVVTEYVEGPTLTQWMLDHPRPDLERVRDIVEQLARGLMALHRLEMLHQDLRPDNVLIDATGTVRIIDFGSTRIAGIAETQPSSAAEPPLGTLQYMAPEYLLGDPGSERAEIFSLGVIAYQLLTGRLPYGAGVARLTSRADLARLRYQPATGPDLPAWVDRALEKAVAIDPDDRYEVLSEFIYDLRHPNPALAVLPRRPLYTRNPLLFWKTLALLLGLTAAVLALLLLQRVGS